MLYNCTFKTRIRCKVLISLLPVPSTPENTYGCCDGYGWDAVKNDCVGMSFEMHFSNINKYHYF